MRYVPEASGKTFLKDAFMLNVRLHNLCLSRERRRSWRGKNRMCTKALKWK